MKKQLSILSVIVLLFAGLMLMSSSTQQKVNNGKKEAGQKPGKGNQPPSDKKTKPGKPGKPENVHPGQGAGNRGNGNDKKDKGNAGRGNANVKNGNSGGGNDGVDFDDQPGNNGKAKKAKINLPGNNNWYSWTRDNYKDRKQFRNKGKVTICHKFSSTDQPVTISVSENALIAHQAHGDVVGDCPVAGNSVFSDIFNRKRSAYYNDVYYGQDQYNYSNSILDYALMRLADSRSQLDYMRANNVAQADIDRRQASVVQLEDNVSLLESLLGVAGELLVSRL